MREDPVAFRPTIDNKKRIERVMKALRTDSKSHALNFMLEDFDETTLPTSRTRVSAITQKPEDRS